MCSTRNSWLVLLAFALAGLPMVGCQRVTTPPPQVAGPEIITDEIQQTRADWPKSTAYFANGDVVAGHSGVVYEPAGSPGVQGLMGVPIFLTNTVLLPFTLIFNPGDQNHAGVQYEPTYTAVAPEK